MMWDEMRKMKSDFTPDRLGPERYGIRRGWWNDDDKWYITFDALKKELKMGPKKLRNYLKNKEVRTITLENSHNHRKFIAYNAEDLGINGAQDEKETLI